jgi:glutamate racemase
MSVVSLIVMEPGSAWPGHVGDSENVVAVGEPGDGMLRRIRSLLDSLRRRGEHVKVAVLACNEATDLVSAVRRAELAHELLAAVAAVGFGRLVLSAEKCASVQVRRELMTLAGALTCTRGRGAATVSVRFGGTQEPRS